ncbi:MAG TPA: MarR family winged helix-turn-helix transcriptional regulator [Steroidobacteraceae bacterium]
MPHPVALQLDTFLPYRLSVLTNILSSAIAGAYRERFNLSIPAWRVLAVLANCPDLSAAEVAQRTAMDKVAVSRAVRGLLQDGRLERRVARGDRRRSVLRLTAAGRQVHIAVAPVALAYEHSLLQSLTRAERIALDRALHILLGRAVEIGPLTKG